MLVTVFASVSVVVKPFVMVLSVVVVRTVAYLVTVIVFAAGVTLMVEQAVLVTVSGERLWVLVLLDVGTLPVDFVPICVRHDTLVFVVLSPPTAAPRAVVRKIQLVRKVVQYIVVLKI